MSTKAAEKLSTAFCGARSNSLLEKREKKVPLVLIEGAPEIQEGQFVRILDRLRRQVRINRRRAGYEVDGNTIVLR